MVNVFIQPILSENVRVLLRAKSFKRSNSIKIRILWIEGEIGNLILGKDQIINLGRGSGRSSDMLDKEARS